MKLVWHVSTCLIVYTAHVEAASPPSLHHTVADVAQHLHFDSFLLHEQFGGELGQLRSAWVAWVRDAAPLKAGSTLAPLSKGRLWMQAK